MPVTNLVENLKTMWIHGIGRKPMIPDPGKDEDLSGTHRIKYYYYDVDVIITSTETRRLRCQGAELLHGGNARYIQFEVNYTTIAEMDYAHPILLSGNFSGCAYKLFRGNSNEIIGAHIDRPKGKGSDALVALADDYANQKNWKELLHIPTRGHIGQGGCTEVYIVSERKLNTVQSILLMISSQGLVVGTSDIYLTQI